MGLLDPPDKVEITRTIVEGHTLRLSPELEAECYKIYWAQRTLGMSDEQVMAYLEENNAERGKAHLIDPYPNKPDTLH
jgi:hypothetical protein